MDAQLEREIMIYLQLEMKKIAIDCKRILQECVERDVYEKYQPIEGGYDRTYNLLTNIDFKVEGNTLYVYNNTSGSNYTDMYGNNVSEMIPEWINYGHKKEGKPNNMFWNYPARHYLEDAKRIIENKYKDMGVIVEIVNI